MFHNLLIKNIKLTNMQTLIRKLQIIILLLTLSSLAFGQRGGGGGGGSSGGGGYSSYGSYGGYGGYGYGYNYGYPGSYYSGTNWWVLGSILGCCGFCCCGFIILAIFQAKRQQNQRQRVISQHMMNHQAKVAQNPTYLTSAQQQQMIDRFKNQRWSISYQDNFDGCLDRSTFNINNIEYKSPSIYQFTAESQDEVGPSHLTGLLTFQSSGMCIIFQKSYNNRQAAGQTNSFTVLIYDGVAQGQNFGGAWFYAGHENQYKYSGKWKMSYY